MEKCPGQDLSKRNPEDLVYNIPCPSCNYELEFWFDDDKLKCNNCGEIVEKEIGRLIKDFGCADWCNFAEKCLGPNLYNKLKISKEKLKEKREKDLELLLSLIDDNEVKEFFKKAFYDNKNLTIFIDTDKSVKPLEKDNPELYKKVIKYYIDFTKNLGGKNE